MGQFAGAQMLLWCIDQAQLLCQAVGIGCGVVCNGACSQNAGPLRLQIQRMAAFKIEFKMKIVRMHMCGLRQNGEPVFNAEQIGC